MQLGLELHCPSRWKILIGYLKELKPRLKELWEPQPTEALFFRKLKCFVKFYREYCKQRTAEYRKDESMACKDLQEVVQDLHENSEERLFQTMYHMSIASEKPGS